MFTMDILENLLYELHKTDECDPSVVINNIIVYFDELNDPTVLEDTLSLLILSEVPPNILLFLHNTIRTKEKLLIRSKILILKFLNRFIKEFHEVSKQQYGSVILEQCYYIFRKEDSNEVKANLLRPIKSILRSSFTYSEVFETTNISPQMLYDALVDELNSNKQAKGLRADILASLGLLVLYCSSKNEVPSEALAWAGTVTDKSIHILTSNVLSHKEPDLPQVTGALSALDRCLYVTISPSINYNDIWKVLLKVISSISNPSVSRYAHVRKALRLICHHAKIFNEVIGLNAQQGYNVVITAYQSKKESIQKYSEDAVLGVLNEVSSYAITATTALQHGNTSYSDLCIKTASSLVGKYIHSLNIASTGTPEYNVQFAGKLLSIVWY